MTKASIINNIKIVALALILAFGISYAMANWTSPTAAPPGNNAAAPINTSSNTQVKAGALGVNGFLTAYTGLSSNNERIVEVATPIDGTDAVNKDYVDAQSGGGVPCGWQMSTQIGSNTPTATRGGCQNQCIAHAVSVSELTGAVSNNGSYLSANSQMIQSIIFQCYAN